MALTWEQRLAEQMLFISTDTFQVEAQAFLDKDNPWQRPHCSLLHEPVIACVDAPIIPVGIYKTALDVCEMHDWPKIRHNIEAVTASMEDFQDEIDPETQMLDFSYTVDLFVGGSAANRNDPDHCRELDFHGLVTEFAENNVRLMDEPYKRLPHPWNKWVGEKEADGILHLLNS